MTIKSILVNISLLSLVVACNRGPDKKQEQRVDETTQPKTEQLSVKLNIETIPANKQEYIIGEIPKVTINQTDTTKFDSIQFYFGNEYLETVTKLPTEVELKRKEAQLGRVGFEARIFSKDQQSTQSQYFRILSDIQPKIYSYQVVKVFPHDKMAYTQGLVYDNGFFYEATGLKGESSLRKVQVETGEILQSFSISRDIFGEGITIFGNKIIQLSWQSHVGFVYDKNSFQLLTKFNYPTEGWGLTNDSTHLIMSDGSNKIYFLDNETYAEISRIEVYDNKGMVNQLNELEYINGEIYANIYQTDKIACIDPQSGKVLSYLDLTGILPKQDYDNDTDVLNGIAYDPASKKLFVTGKRWPKIFEIKLK